MLNVIHCDINNKFISRIFFCFVGLVFHPFAHFTCVRAAKCKCAENAMVKMKWMRGTFSPVFNCITDISKWLEIRWALNTYTAYPFEQYCASWIVILFSSTGKALISIYILCTVGFFVFLCSRIYIVCVPSVRNGIFRCRLCVCVIWKAITGNTIKHTFRKQVLAKASQLSCWKRKPLIVEKRANNEKTQNENKSDEIYK